MAISPTVNAHMQQNQGPPQSAEQLFNQQFTSQAYNTFQAKYPSLVNGIVTLKVLSSDMDDGNAFGVLVLKKGSDIVFVPVVMAGGSITSCEMVYDRGADQFSPLIDATVRELKALSDYADPVLLGKKPPRVEDTRALFQNMIRPPVSSNVILAGERGGIAALPNRHKEVLATYLEKENPALLARVAEFYDVDALAAKLASVPEEVARKDVTLPSFLRLDALSKEAAEALDMQERQALLRDGYFIKGAGEGDALYVSPVETLMHDMETELRLGLYPDMRDSPTSFDDISWTGDPVIRHSSVGSADLVQISSEGVRFVPVLLCGNDIIAKDTYRSLSKSRTVLVSNQMENPELVSGRIEAFDIIFPLSRLRERLAAEQDKQCWVHIHLFIPARKSGWLFTDTEYFMNADHSSWQSAEHGDDLVISVDGRDSSIIATPKINRGYIINGRTLMVPKETRCMLSTSKDRKSLPGIESFDVFRKLICSLGSRLVRTDDGAGISVTDMRSRKTASFASPADAASWLHDVYGMNGQQVRTVLSSDQCHVFSKRAFAEEMPGQVEEMTESSAQGSLEQPAAGFDPSSLDDFAELGDEEVMDTGILASFAQDPDIKGMLVEYLPDFIQTQDRLGRIILLMSAQKIDLEDFYGSEKYTTLLGSCRKIFQVIGDLVVHLKTYINMQ